MLTVGFGVWLTFFRLFRSSSLLEYDWTRSSNTCTTDLMARSLCDWHTDCYETSCFLCQNHFSAVSMVMAARYTWHHLMFKANTMWICLYTCHVIWWPCQLLDAQIRPGGPTWYTTVKKTVQNDQQLTFWARWNEWEEYFVSYGCKWNHRVRKYDTYRAYYLSVT